MDIWEAVRVVGRHWLVVALGMVLAALATVNTYRGTEASYEAHGSAIVIPARATVDQQTQRVIDNPYSGERHLVGAAQLAGEIGRGDDVAATVETKLGDVPEYVVEVSATAPIINVIAAGPTAPFAIQTVVEVLGTLSAELERRQGDTGVPESSRLRVDVLSRPTKALEVNASRVKSTGLIAGLGTVAAISLAFLAEAIRGGSGGGRRARGGGWQDTRASGDGAGRGGWPDDDGLDRAGGLDDGGATPGRPEVGAQRLARGR